jgi:hypothetical protein
LYNYTQEDLLEGLKVLADQSRLTLLQLLGEQEYAVGDLARAMNLSEPTISHHLTRLREVNFVTLRMAGTQRFYRLNAESLSHFKQLVMNIEKRPPTIEKIVPDQAWIAALGWDEADQEVLKEYAVNGVLTRLPSKQKKLLVILRWLATLFEPERMYTEPEVNAILKVAYALDYVGLRRDLVDFGYLRRERGGGKYWLAPAEPEDSEAQG